MPSFWYDFSALSFDCNRLVWTHGNARPTTVHNENHSSLLLGVWNSFCSNLCLVISLIHSKMAILLPKPPAAFFSKKPIILQLFRAPQVNHADTKNYRAGRIRGKRKWKEFVRLACSDNKQRAIGVRLNNRSMFSLRTRMQSTWYCSKQPRDKCCRAYKQTINLLLMVVHSA